MELVELTLRYGSCLGLSMDSSCCNEQQRNANQMMMHAVRWIAAHNVFLFCIQNSNEIEPTVDNERL